MSATAGRRPVDPIPWDELSPEHRELITGRLADVTPGLDPAEHWREMGPVNQHDWLSVVTHPDNARGAYEAEVRRISEGVDPETNDAFDILTASEPGHLVLDDVRAFLRRLVAFPTDACLDAVTLWAAHTHLATVSESTPRLAVLSPEPGSGKTRVLEVLELLVPSPMWSLNASPPAIFRTLRVTPQATLLFDEVDAVFGRRGKDDGAEDLRALLNAGHRKGATIPRCEGPSHMVTHFPVFAPAAMAGLGDLPDTLMSRSVVIRMRRRLSTEVVEQFRRRIAQPVGAELRARLEEWSASAADEVAVAFPEMPVGVVDRPADVWEPLLAVADAAGGHWPISARAACLELVKVVEDRDSTSLGIRLLGDLREVMGDDEKLSTEDVIERLTGLEEAPWGNLGGSPLTPRRLARLLRDYGIKSRKIRFGSKTLNGWVRAELVDAWDRYLPPYPGTPEHPEHPEHPRSGGETPTLSVLPVPELDELPVPALDESAHPIRNGSEQEGSGCSVPAGGGAPALGNHHQQQGTQDASGLARMAAARSAAGQPLDDDDRAALASQGWS